MGLHWMEDSRPMFLMAFHRAAGGWLGVIHIDEAGKGLRVLLVLRSWILGEQEREAG